MALSDFVEYKGPGSPLLISPTASGADAPMQAYFGRGHHESILFHENNLTFWYNDLKQMKSLGDFVIAKLLANEEKVFNDFYAAEKRFDAVFKRVEAAESELKKLPDVELAALFDELFKAYEGVYAVGMLIEPFMVSIDDLITNELKKTLAASAEGSDKKFSECLTTLFQPTRKTFQAEAEESLLRVLALEESGAGGERVRAALEAHADEFFWVSNNYYDTPVRDADYFAELLKEKKKEGMKPKQKIAELEEKIAAAKPARERLLKEVKAGGRLRELVALADDVGFLQDRRKTLMMRGVHYEMVLAREVARRRGVGEKEIKMLVPQEVRGFLLDGFPSKTGLEERLKACLTVFSKGEFKVYAGEEAKRKRNELLGLNEGRKDDAAKRADVLGTCASLGKIVGTARIIMTPAEFNNLAQGEILVTSMTRPEFVPIMKRAGAIVTDEGGVTCHAAIISRELGIPCVVGTRVATRTFHDGDTVEVDANHGMVKLLNRASD